MVMPHFNNWGFLFSMLYIPLTCLNIILAPFLRFGMWRGVFKQEIWIRYLLINGLVSIVFVFFLPFNFVVDFMNYGIMWEADVLRFGIITQEIFFVVWVIHYCRQKVISNLFYKVWSWCFFLLYLLPSTISFTWLVVKI